MNKLEISGLSVSFGGIRAVSGVNLSVAAKQVLSVVGPNGAGKSTIFNVITRVIDPDAGSVSFDGVDLLSVKPKDVVRKGIARTFQNLELFASATVEENIMMGRHIHIRTLPWQEAIGFKSVRRQEHENRRQVDELIAFLNLGNYRDVAVSKLPYGICKLVELGRALACEPSLLLLDEPAAGLNTRETQSMAEWIRDINRRLGTTIVLIEHDMHLVGQVSDWVVVLDSGKVLAEGTPEDVRRRPEVITAYLEG